MKLPIYFVSDNHFQFSENKNELIRRKLIFNLFDKIESTNGTLIIGGDFFDFWYDYGNEQIPGYENIFNALSKLYSRGIDIHYVLGNHDFWDFGYFNNKFGAKLYRQDLEFKIENERILVTHGDGLLRKDHGYRLMRKVIRHPLSIFLFGLLRSNIGCKLANRISKTSRHFNNDYQDDNENIIKKDITEFAKIKFKDNYDTILVVHYHRLGIDKHGKNRLIWMGDWIKFFSVTIRDEKGWKQLNWNYFSDK